MEKEKVLDLLNKTNKLIEEEGKDYFINSLTINGTKVDCKCAVNDNGNKVNGIIIQEKKKNDRE